MKAILTDETLAFTVDMPDNPDAQELGYFRWFVGEIIDSIMENLGPEKARLFTKSERNTLTKKEELALKQAQGGNNVRPDEHTQGPHQDSDAGQERP